MAAQRDTNPFPYSDDNKRYHTFDYFARRTFGGKCVRIALDAGFTCPNQDGTVGVGGCSFCAGGSSGAEAGDSLEVQYARGIERLSGKWTCTRFIPYLQANTNTYAPPARLESIYARCASLPGAVMLAIGTRADCLSDGVIDVLRRTSERIPLLVELGMQSMHDRTLAAVGRGYSHDAFVRGYTRLRSAGGNIRIGLHLMNGLPGESRADMLASVAEAARLGADLVKLHTLCVLREARLAHQFDAGDYTPLTREECISLVCDELTLLPPEMVVARLCADARRADLIAPDWVRRKREFSNAVDQRMYALDLWQGKENGVNGH